MIRRDVPAVLIVSNVFSGLAKGEAEAFGYREFPMLVFPHPLTVRATEEVYRFAEEKAKQLLEECMEGRI
jgi:hypothetical protein